jgi:ubiquinone/menaquinone biosynthesis C-methylase UbiE
MGSADFTRASRAVWDEMAPAWDRLHAYIEELTRPVTELMLERAALGGGQTVLDLAAGTGVVGLAAAAAVGPDGRVILGDLSPAMVEAAERQAARLRLENVDCRVLDAERLDLPEDAVDAVLCRWGYMLMADPAAALAETRRVLRPDARLSCAVFGAPTRNPWAAMPSRVLQERGHMPPPESGSPGIMALADPERLDGLLDRAGFASREMDEVAFTWTFADADEYWAFLTELAGAISMVVARLDDDQRAEVRAEITEAAGAFRADGGIEMPAACLVAVAS